MTAGTRQRVGLRELMTQCSAEGAFGGSTRKSFSDLTADDAEFLERALHEYREASWDESSFEDLSPKVQDRVLRRAQEMKTLGIRLGAILSQGQQRAG